MGDIFSPNCRIEKVESGISFYEQDILCCNYVFTGDIKINITANILAPGFGVVLFKDNSKTALEANDIIIAKLGSLDFSVINKSYTTYSIPVHSSCNITPPVNDASISFIKSGAKLSMYYNGMKAGEYTMKNPYDSYRIGFYSNAGNIIKYADIISGVPKRWDVNVKNTNGGRIRFFMDGFLIENCEHDLEVEQDTISLKKGSYTLDYKKSEDSDINAYVFSYDDKEVDDVVKNMVEIKDGIFKLESDGYVDLKFKGHNGTIRNVCIKDDPKSNYVETDDVSITLDGSWIKINMAGLTKIEWSGIVYDIPDQSDLTKEIKYSLVETTTNNYKIGNLDVLLNKSYDYSIDVNQLKLSVSDRTEQMSIVEADNNTVTIFNNVNAKITKLILTDINGNTINVLVQKTYKFYLPASIAGPVIVTDVNEIPLDISSSYRFSNSDKTYVFTNWEREIFNSSNYLQLENTPLGDNGTFIIYGIPEDSVFDKDKIYEVPNANSINSIDLSASKYTIIKDYEYDDSANILSLNDNDKAKYSYFIVDYLKKNTYCINYIESLNNYEVDISTDLDTLYIIHEKDTSNGYITTQISPTANKYIVLRGGVEA